MILNHKEAIRTWVQNISLPDAERRTIRTPCTTCCRIVSGARNGRANPQRSIADRHNLRTSRGKRTAHTVLESAARHCAPHRRSSSRAFFSSAHISYLQAFVDVNKRTARLASIIPLITQDYVPQSFVDVSKDDYLRRPLFSMSSTTPGHWRSYIAGLPAFLPALRHERSGRRVR